MKSWCGYLDIKLISTRVSPLISSSRYAQVDF